MKKILICIMAAGLMSGFSFAQRARTMGPGPAARAPGMQPASPNFHMGANSVTGHDGVLPSAVPAGTRAKTTTPNATTGDKTKTVAPNANPTSDRVILPDAQGASDHTRINPNQ